MGRTHTLSPLPMQRYKDFRKKQIIICHSRHPPRHSPACFSVIRRLDRRISFLQGGAGRAADVRTQNVRPPAPCRLSAKCLQRQPTHRTLPTAPDGTGKRAQAPARPTRRLARNRSIYLEVPEDNPAGRSLRSRRNNLSDRGSKEFCKYSRLTYGHLRQMPNECLRNGHPGK